MQYRRDLIPRPTNMTHSPVGSRLPSVYSQPVPYGKSQRLISIERTAASNGYEAINGLGVMDGTNIKAVRIDGRLDRRMSFVGPTSLSKPNFKLPTQPISRVPKGRMFRDLSLQGLGDGPVPGSNDPGFWSSLNTALSTPQVNALVGAGANFYVQHETGAAAQSIANAQVKTAALQAQLNQQKSAAAAANKSTGTPSWLMPAVAIGGVGLVAVLFLSSRRK